MTDSILVLYTATTPTTSFSVVHILFIVYILQMASTVVGNHSDYYK